MGMSEDFEVAIEEGATCVRIGTALFGARESAMIGLPKSVGTIGAGNMAEAILRGLLARGAVGGPALGVGPRRRAPPGDEGELGVHATTSNADVAARAEVVVLAVKPQQLERAAETLPRDGGPLYLSIVAGATTATLRRLLGAGARIVRSMPNTPPWWAPASPRWRADGGAEPERRRSARARSCAQSARSCRSPKLQLDAVTGLSGSGPAYAFLFIEALTEAGVREGLAVDVARALALETVHGAARLARETGEHPALLRERVTSPGGTTAAGLAALEAGGFRTAIHEAVRSGHPPLAGTRKS